MTMKQLKGTVNNDTLEVELGNKRSDHPARKAGLKEGSALKSVYIMNIEGLGYTSLRYIKAKANDGRQLEHSRWDTLYEQFKNSEEPLLKYIKSGGKNKTDHENTNGTKKRGKKKQLLTQSTMVECTFVVR